MHTKSSSTLQLPTTAAWDESNPAVAVTSAHSTIKLEQSHAFDELEALGFTQEVPRDISALGIICIGWNICNSWAGVAGTLALTIALGGSVTAIYGAIVCFVAVGCSGLTMAELVSVYPTAGGQCVLPILPFTAVLY